jgi:hypothetical protein
MHNHMTFPIFIFILKEELFIKKNPMTPLTYPFIKFLYIVKFRVLQFRTVKLKSTTPAKKANNIINFI